MSHPSQPLGDQHYVTTFSANLHENTILGKTHPVKANSYTQLATNQLKGALELVYPPHPEHPEGVGEAQATLSRVQPPGPPRDPSRTQEQDPGVSKITETTSINAGDEQTWNFRFIGSQGVSFRIDRDTAVGECDPIERYIGGIGMRKR